jgi:hypothetical protein
MRAQTQFLAFLFEQIAGIGDALQCIAQVREPHEPHGMGEVFFAAYMESDPA